MMLYEKSVKWMVTIYIKIIEKPDMKSGFLTLN